MKLNNPFFQLFDLARLETSPTQVALGFTLGMLLGLTPTMTLQFGIFFIAVFLLRANLLALFFSCAFFCTLSLTLDPVFDAIGTPILTQTPALLRLWAGLYHLPVITFTRFHNTVVMGSLVVCTILTPILFFSARKLWSRYQEDINQWFNYSSFGIWWSTSFMNRLYARYRAKKR